MGPRRHAARRRYEPLHRPSDEFEALWRRYARPLRYFVSGVAGEDAEDAVQEIMIKAYRGLSTLGYSGNPTAWIYTIARNHCTDLRRSPRRAERHRSSSLEPDRTPARVDDQPEHILLAVERRKAVQAAMATLPDADRQILFLSYFEGLTCAEIGRILGRPAGTIKYRIHRAKAVLRRRLEEDV